MKRIVLMLLFHFGFGLASQSQPAILLSDSTELQASMVLDQWHRDAAEGNHESYIGAMTSSGVFIGTDASEYWTTEEFKTWTKPYFDKKKTWNFKTIQRNLYLGKEGNSAWFDELLSTQMGICRGSGVLQKQDGRWKIAQYVLSATIPNDIMKKVTSLKSGIDSALILKLIFDKYELTGTLMIMDLSDGRTFGYNSARWDSGYLPASTFKIANTLIGLETGVIAEDKIFKWDGKPRRLPQWEQDLPLRDAFQVSCVPCYQDLARKIGTERMKAYLEKMNYPGMDVKKENIDLFWLEGNSRITPRQQVEFIRALYEEKLPLKKSVMQSVKAIMLSETSPGYSVSGKTGWSIRNGNNYGWFVGYIETNGKVYCLATLVEPKNQETPGDFAMARKSVTMEVMKYLGIIK